MVLSIIIFLCITLFFVLAATVPQDVFGEERHFFNWKTNADWFEETYNVNIFVYFSWKFFENLTKIVIAVIYFKSLLIIAKLPAKTKKTNLLFFHALFMFITIFADITCTTFVIVTAYKERGTFYKGIVISFAIWRICDTIYIIFMLTIASQFTTYFIMRQKEKDDIRNGIVSSAIGKSFNNHSMVSLDSEEQDSNVTSYVSEEDEQLIKVAQGNLEKKRSKESN